MKWEQDDYWVTTDSHRLNLELIHSELTRSYWAEGIPFHIVQKSIQHSLCFGVYHRGTGEQADFARVVSDFTTFAFLCDVFVISKFKGKGLSKFLIGCIMAHPELKGLRRFCLGTKDAHGLYEKYGFKAIKEPKNWMEIKHPNIYRENHQGKNIAVVPPFQTEKK